MTPTKKQLENGTYKLINGKWHKRCTGPAHEEPEYLPATNKYFHSHKSGVNKGKFLTRCRLCINWTKLKTRGSHHGLVEVEKVFPLYVEAVNRIGIEELAKRAGVSVGHIEHVVRKETKHVQKRPVRAVLLELTSLKRKGEVSKSASLRHRNDARNNSGFDTCAGCGTPKTNITRGCENCWSRYYDMYRRKKISKAEWSKIRVEYFPGGIATKLHMGREVK